MLWKTEFLAPSTDTAKGVLAQSADTGKGVLAQSADTGKGVLAQSADTGKGVSASVLSAKNVVFQSKFAPGYILQKVYSLLSF